MIRLLILAATLFVGTIVSIYTLSVEDIDSNMIRMNNYRDKKILLVNTASNSSSAAQLSELQQLYLQHKDSMVIIAFPSNSFDNEPLSDTALKTLMQGTYGITFPIAAKSHVRGDSINLLYRWLATKTENDVMNGKVNRDFQKFLIDKSGSIIGRFDSSIHPLSAILQDAIQNN